MLRGEYEAHQRRNLGIVVGNCGINGGGATLKAGTRNRSNVASHRKLHKYDAEITINSSFPAATRVV